MRPIYAGGERSYDIEAGGQRFGVALVQCDVEGPIATVRPHHSSTARHPMRVAAAVSVPAELWHCENRTGRLIEDHGAVVTVWATPDDLKSVLERWPQAPTGIEAAYSVYLRDYAADALSLRDDLEAGWMQRAGRSAASAAESGPEVQEEPGLSL